MSKKNGNVNLQLVLECEVRDKNGKLISKHQQASKSLLRNFALALRGLMYGGATNGSVTLTDTGGAGRGYPNLMNQASAVFSVNAGTGNDNYGIQVGVGTTGVTRGDYKLENKIPNGSGAGQLSYGASTIETPDGTPPDTTFRVIRPFTNNSNASITVNEIGLVFYEYQGTSPNDVYFMIARDVLSSPQSVPSGATLTVRYMFKVTA